jgi:hypothetical protein
MPFRLAALALLLAAAAAAQEQQPPETGGLGGQNVPNAAGISGQAFTDPSQLFSGKAGLFFGVGVNKIQGEGIYASTVINTEFSLGPVGVGLGVPIELLVWNDDKCCGPDPDAQGNHPHSRDYKTYGGLIRKRDWDEPQDYARLVRFIRYGHKRDPVYVLAGQLWGATIGHGTLVNRYTNSLNLDHPKFGLALDLNGTFFGIETLTDYVSNPALLGARAYVRPFGDTLIARGWAVGVTVVTDRTAPRHLATNLDGSLQQDSVGNPIIDVNNAVYAGGVDTEYELLRNSIISLIPYVDLNRIAGAGNGLHAGVLTDIYLPVPILEINVAARLEYRMMQAGYIPEYFDQTYDLGRVQYAVSTGTTTTYEPKYVVAQSAHLAATDPRAIDKKGYYGELALGFAGFLQVGGLYQSYEGDPNGASLGLFATFPKIELVKIAGYYLRKNMKPGFDDAFKLDERSLLAASIAYKILGPIYLRVDFQRRWQLQPGGKQITAVNNFQAGIAAFASF